MKIGIENYFASLSSFEQHFCTLWNFSFSRLYFSLKNRMRRCYFKTANSQQLKLFIFHCVTFLESLFRKDCGALILKQPTAVIIHFPLRDNYLISTTANCLRITCDHFRLLPARPHNCCCEWRKMAPQYTAKMRTFMAVEYNKRAGTRDFVDGIVPSLSATETSITDKCHG